MTLNTHDVIILPYSDNNMLQFLNQERKKAMNEMDLEKLKKTLREIDSRIHSMQQQLDELHDMSYQIRELVMDEEDKKPNFLDDLIYKGWAVVDA